MKYDTVSVVTTCLALSVAYPSKQLAGPLYLFGATIAYDIGGMAGIDLASSALEICDGVVPEEISAESFDYLNKVTNLQWISDPFLSIAVSAVSLCVRYLPVEDSQNENENENQNETKVKTQRDMIGNAIAALTHLMNAEKKLENEKDKTPLLKALTSENPENIIENSNNHRNNKNKSHKSNENDWINNEKVDSVIAASLLVYLKAVEGDENVLKQVKMLLEEKPELFGGLSDGYGDGFIEANDARCFAQLFTAKRREKIDSIPTSLDIAADESNPIVLNKKRIQRLIQKIQSL